MGIVFAFAFVVDLGLLFAKRIDGTQFLELLLAAFLIELVIAQIERTQR